MNDERKILYISVTINLVIGCMIGIILFYGQVRNIQSFPEKAYTYDRTVSFEDFFRLSWLNMLWAFSVLIAHSILPVRTVHPIVAVRGCVTSFSMLYMLSVFGMREAASAIIPQCFSVLPFLMWFSVITVLKQRENVKNGSDVCSLKRAEVASIFVFSAAAAVAEVLFFKFFCIYLF